MSIDIAPYLVGVEEAIARATRGSSFITPDNWNLLTTWGLWVFKSKSENLQYYRKDDAAAVNR
jgi:hypothetical protein